MDDVTIVGMNLRSIPRRDERGTYFLAEFDFTDGRIVVHRSLLVKTADGQFQAWLPRRRVRFVYRADIFKLTEKAVQSFKDMGGNPYPEENEATEGLPVTVMDVLRADPVLLAQPPIIRKTVSRVTEGTDHKGETE